MDASVSAISPDQPRSARAFETAVVPDARRLYTLSLSILRDPGESEDAVQETLLKAWRSWPSLSHSDHVSRWLTRVCVNHCISRRRHLRSRGWPPIELFEAAGSTGDRDDGAEVVDIDRAYRRLSLRQRAAVTLNYRYGYSVEECAGLMDVGPGPCADTWRAVSPPFGRSSAMLDIDPGLDSKLRTLYEHIEAQAPSALAGGLRAAARPSAQANAQPHGRGGGHRRCPRGGRPVRDRARPSRR